MIDDLKRHDNLLHKINFCPQCGNKLLSKEEKPEYNKSEESKLQDKYKTYVETIGESYRTYKMRHFRGHPIRCYEVCSACRAGGNGPGCDEATRSDGHLK